jgi:hypothetical protein
MTRDQAVAVPAAVVRQLVDSIGAQSPPPKPFPRSGDLRQPVTAGDNPQTPRPEQEFEETIAQLLNDLDSCRKTDWSADNETEFASLQSLSRNLSNAYEWLALHRQQLEEPEACQAKLDAAMKQITISLQDDLVEAEFMAGKGNEFFFRMVNPQNPWFLIAVQVTLDQFSSPVIQNRETVVFEVLGTGKHVIAYGGPDARDFRKGRYFLLLGRLDPAGPVRSGMFEGESQIPRIGLHANVRVAVQPGPLP